MVVWFTPGRLLIWLVCSVSRTRLYLWRTRLYLQSVSVPPKTRPYLKNEDENRPIGAALALSLVRRWSVWITRDMNSET